MVWRRRAAGASLPVVAAALVRPRECMGARWLPLREVLADTSQVHREVIWRFHDHPADSLCRGARAPHCAQPAATTEVRALAHDNSEARGELAWTFQKIPTDRGLDLMPCMWRPLAGTVRASGETGTMAAVDGTNSECYFLFLMAADITCRLGRTFQGTCPETGKP